MDDAGKGARVDREVARQGRDRPEEARRYSGLRRSALRRCGELSDSTGRASFRLSYPRIPS